MQKKQESGLENHAAAERQLLAVLTALKNGNFSARLPQDWTGVSGKIADTLNEILSRQERLAEEFARVAATVGKDGKISDRVARATAAGGWAAQVDSVNSLINDLAQPTVEMARVIGAVAKGDLTQAMPLELEGHALKGEFVRTAKIVNGMVAQLNSFASEVTRVAREVGTDGKLGGQAKVKDVAGTWRDLTESVNQMASNLTGQVRNIADVTISVANGDLSKKITVDVRGEFLQLKDTINRMVDQLRSFASEVTRVAREVGSDGKLGGQAVVPGVAGVWKDLTDNVNGMATNLTTQVRNLADVTTAVAMGDLTRKVTVDVNGEMLELKNTVNTMVDQLNSFAAEVTRVAREVGTDGKLGGQAEVRGVAGTWRDLTEKVNLMASNLTNQVRNIAQVTTAVATGDLSKKITVEARGEILELKDTINTMVDQLNSFASEVTRVAREVGTDGKLGGQAEVRGVGGTWKDLTDNVNQMANNLTSQVRNIADVTTAVASGDLARKITVDAKGEILELKNTINTMVDRLNSFAAEVTRVAREVGSDGMLGGQAQVADVAGTWKDLTDSVNGMAANLTAQVRNIADVTTAVANGNLARKITVDAKGEILELKNTINTMVDRLNAFAAEVTRVAREVGSDGMLGGQAEVAGVAGTWKDLTDNVNGMAANLTAQVRNIADVTTAVARGDLTRTITVDAKGEILELKNTINTMVDQLNAFASEVTRVAREVGTDGKLGGQAAVQGVAGTWRDLTDSVNGMAANLTNQVRNIAQVTTAVAGGDLSKKITVDARGEILELKNTVNAMVDRLNAFAAEVTRVAREVGTDGKLGGQAAVQGVAGTWKDLTDNVNGMAANLTAQVRNIADVTTAVARGDLTRTITVDARGEILELKDTINTMVDQLNAFASEVTRVAREVGTDGKLGGQAAVQGVAGTWRDLTDSVNGMAANLTNQVRNIAQVTTAVANGDLNRKITVDARGEILDLKDTINTMVDQLNSFAAEVTRVAREVGTDGKLGGQAQVRGVAGTWKDLTDNVNGMAANLTDQVRGIAKVVTAVASGNLKLKLAVEAKGEIAALADTINGMIDTLATFADQVTSVAREVGTEGRLGGQAQVPGAAGTWKDLTDNVNRLAANLTSQVRAIADVSTAVTKGDLSRSVTVEAEGEVALLKDNVNEMIRNLRDTTRRNTEQDWLKSNLATFTRKLQGQRDLQAVCKMTLSDLAPLVQAQHGVFYVHDERPDGALLHLLASYAYRERKHVADKFTPGEGLIGQCVLEKQRILLTHVPADYVQISSGLGEATPMNLVVLPVVFEDQVKAVIELSSFERFSETHITFLDQLMESLGIVINTIQANTRTEELLKQSQSLTEELQGGQAELQDKNKRLEEQARSLRESEELLKKQQGELQVTNEELEEKALELEEQRKKVEFKNRELEMTQASLAERAEQLSITSRYKSEFLANMSHELRTPLNSLLLLSNLLCENKDGNLTPKQLEHIRTIHGGGNDLLSLINEILDLSKIEAGKMDIAPADVALADVCAFAERGFKQIAEHKGLEFPIDLAADLPKVIRTDRQRLEQMLRNLLSNALKFTEHGSVSLAIRRAAPDTSFANDALRSAAGVVAFAVTDTGIGVPKDKQRAIWEAFQQADGTTSRKYGGTGLGLTISREIAQLLGGEIHLASEEGRGSTFTLYLPLDLEAGAPRAPAPLPDTPAAPPPPAASATSPVAPAAAPGNIVTTPVPVADDRYAIGSGDRKVLIVEDDSKFASILKDIVHEHGFKVLLAERGEDGLSLAHEFRPDAILLDLMLPGMDGWEVMTRLKAHTDLRHIPVQIISGMPERQRGLQAGAFDYLTKPVSKPALDDALARVEALVNGRTRQLLVVEDNETERAEIVRLIGNGDVVTTAVASGQEALAALQQHNFDCMILDLMLPDLNGFQVLEKMRTTLGLAELPVIVYTAKDLTEREAANLSKHVHTVVVKGALALPRLLDETALFLHRVAANLPASKQQLIHQLHDQDAVLAGKKVLIVDDDVRNIYALTSALEHRQMQVLHAEDGNRGIEVLQAHPDADLVLMDIMMPVKDGYDTIREIRGDPRFKALPILALTAKAMKGDREKCIAAGASDYVSKPVNLDRLISLLRVWLYK